MLTPATSSSVFAGFTAVSAVSTVCSVKDGEGSSGPISHGVPFFLSVFSHFAAFTAMLWPSMAVLSWASTSLLMPAEIRPVEVVTNAFLSWESQKCLKVTSVVYRFSFFISACRLGWWRRWPTPLFSWEKNPTFGGGLRLMWEMRTRWKRLTSHSQNRAQTNENGSQLGTSRPERLGEVGRMRKGSRGPGIKD